MGFPIVQTSVARKDMVDIADYLSIQNVDVGFRFYDCVDQSLLRLSDMPPTFSEIGNKMSLGPDWLFARFLSVS